MRSNKDRLYLALYARGGKVKMPGREDTYHWALMVGPKKVRQEDYGVRYHARERFNQEGRSTWFFEEKRLSMMPVEMVLTRIVLAKVHDTERLAQLLRETPIRQGEVGWNCVGWVKEALAQLEHSQDIIGTCVLEWEEVRGKALSYCQEKRDQLRFDSKGNFDPAQVPTFDLIQEQETLA